MGMISPTTLKVAARTFSKEAPDMYQSFMSNVGAEGIADIVNKHALCAAAASLAAGWIPGVGGAACLLASVGFIWAMYYRVNSAVGIKLSKNVAKSLASAILTNIVTQVGGLLLGTAAASILSFIPGIGSVASDVIMAAIVYATVIAAGIVYLKMLTKLFKAEVNLESVSESELKNAAKSAADETDLKGVVSEARDAYKSAKKSGEVSGKEDVDISEFKE